MKRYTLQIDIEVTQQTPYSEIKAMAETLLEHIVEATAIRIYNPATVQPALSFLDKSDV